MGWIDLGAADCFTNYCTVGVNATLFSVFCYRGGDENPIGSLYRASGDKAWTGQIPGKKPITKEKYVDICEAFRKEDILTPNPATVVSILNDKKNKDTIEKNNYLKEILSLLEGEKNVGK